MGWMQTFGPKNLCRETDVCFSPRSCTIIVFFGIQYANKWFSPRVFFMFTLGEDLFLGRGAKIMNLIY